MQPPIFARFLAKVAYGFAVWHYGLDCIDENYIVPSIRGDDTRLGRWIGSVKEEDQLIHTKGVHLSLAGITADGTIIVRLRLLALFDTPEYIVIIGKIKPECLEREKSAKTLTGPYLA